MNFKIGDKVRFLNDVGDAEVVKMNTDGTVVVCDESGFEYAYPASELIPLNNAFDENEAYSRVEPDVRSIIERNIDESVMKEARKDFEIKYKNREATSIRRKGEFMEIDLHIHELIDSEAGLSSGEKLAIQISHFERMMKRAESQHISRVIVIHGIGQGVLKAEIRKALELYYPNTSFHDAPYHEYGHGATEIEIRRSV